MNFYQSVGSLVLGTRFRRLSEYFLNEVNKTYKRLGINFEASWFGVFYLLDTKTEVSIKDISETLEISHSAVSQLVKMLVLKNLVVFENSKNDARKKIIHFTPEGVLLLTQIKPVWDALEKAMNELLQQENCIQLLDNIVSLETALNKTSLIERICLNMEKIP